DGSEPPPILCILPGLPTLYVCADAIFEGPEPHEHVLEPLKETRIPAPAIEQPSGVAFLQSLGVELPERVRERVRTVEYEVAIKCELKPSFPRADSEDCIVTVVAEAADGKQQTWTGYNWLEQTQNERRRRSRREEMITLYDRRKLEAVPALL